MSLDFESIVKLIANKKTFRYAVWVFCGTFIPVCGILLIALRFVEPLAGDFCLPWGDTVYSAESTCMVLLLAAVCLVIATYSEPQPLITACDPPGLLQRARPVRPPMLCVFHHLHRHASLHNAPLVLGMLDDLLLPVSSS